MAATQTFEFADEVFWAAEVPALQGVLSAGSTGICSHQRFCSEAACRKQSKAESQRRWVQKPDNQNYFSGPQNSQRIKEWRKRTPGYWRKKSPPPQEPLQDLCRTQVAQDEEVKTIEISDALQDVLVMQPAVMVGLISMMTGSALQEDIAATTRTLLKKARTSWPGGSGVRTTHSHDDNQKGTLSGTAAPCAAPL